MSSYISNKFIRFSLYIGSLLLPFIATNTLAIGEKNTEQQTQTVANENQLDNRGDGTAGLIAQNIQTVSRVLSSSPSQLTEQAKSYALGKLNGTISSETQKWLSQFGTARINFALDRKGKLDNGSLDMLLPLYDNKADWLVFSQFGYRHKDSRHTVNVGLGGRYFTPHWMYGLNTFFDHDVTGKNQRLGVGAEAWTDYVKLSANSYLRLTEWRQSLKDHDWEERPANGFDLQGEFYLPAYPNLGGKLGFEQYFGDNVALFNRDSKQKNPSLGRVGLNYTPIPLVTMGVDYKYGGSGHSETLFQANLNYRFGVPWDAQFSPGSVASMRTLAGSRYDLVERNNHIVLDHRKKPDELELTMSQNTIFGYSQQTWPTPLPITANIKSSVKKIIFQADNAFTQNGGSIATIGGGNELVTLVLPKYIPDGQNTHTVNIFAEGNNGKVSKPAILNVTVQPFVVRQFKAEQLTTSNTGAQGGYNLLATIAHGAADKDIIRNGVIDNVTWSIEPQSKDVSLNWENPSRTNSQGQLQATVITSQPLKDVKVFLEIPGMPKTHVGDIGFSGLISDFKIQSVTPFVSGPLLAGDNGYTFTAVVKDKNGIALKNQKVDVKWYPETLPDGMKWSSVQNTTNTEGKLFATLTSTKPVKDIKVGASIDGGKTTTYTEKPVAFVGDIKIGDIEVTPNKDLNGDGKEAYLYKAKIKDAATDLAIPNLTFDHDKVIWSMVNDKFDHNKLVEEGKLVFGNKQLTTDDQGYLTTTLTSSVGVDNVNVKLELVKKEGKQESIANTTVKFIPVEQPVGLYIYNGNNPSVNHFYKSDENGPYNVFDALNAELRRDPNTPLIDPNIEEGKYTVVSGQVAEQSMGSDNVFDFVLDGLHFSLAPTKLKATATNKQTGAIATYTYTVKPLRYFRTFDPQNHKMNSQTDHACEIFAGKNNQAYNYASVTVTDLWPLSSSRVHNEKYGTTLLEEFPNIMDWGLIGQTGVYGNGTDPNNPAILVSNNINPEVSKHNYFVGFDVVKHEIVDKSSVNKLITCLITH
ncbi:inverse autotransporter-like protein with beta domain [Xenorhabdus ehlersii]|uniref:Inverse autotransporter-like protein with beta domain n=1 Tax=Xenorhabdus ehlersii TaxID=290111 RepID=A0A2D0IPQ1_9GAMM|nr:putative Bacterial Ig-like domain [Xenorhabdus sp. TS4]PHM23789.1 putative Bacterial Ig-like domain [Xenorhabdus ehlersii]RKE89246.1 inverse autotransporter-like protein with beta domain [Xenorhabdus ehlersii]